MAATTEYPIVDIPPEAREDTEQLGSKPKFWVTLDKHRWLFKEARPNTGEDWAEKVAAELARIIGMEAAEVELASFAGKRGCVSKNFIDRSKGEALVHGNELLGSLVKGYDKSKVMKQSNHNVLTIITSVVKFFPEQHRTTALEQLAEYMVFDALITNTDRHHENWGLRIRLMEDGFTVAIAPSFDHASSMGRECLEGRAMEIVKSGTVANYVAKARGGVYWMAIDPKGANPLELVKLAANAYPEYFKPAIARVAKLTEAEIKWEIDRIPAHLASEAARQLATQMICYSLNEIRQIRT